MRTYFGKKIHKNLIIGLLSCLLFCFVQCKKGTNAGGGSIQPTTTTPSGGILVTDTKQYMGVNYNENLDAIIPDELKRSKTTWVRGFLDVFYHYDNNNITTSPRITSYLTLKDAGYKTILNLKFNFKTRPYPAINSKDWNNYLNYIDVVLDRVITGTDVIVVGNEPFIESDPSTYNEPLNSFYRAAAERVNNYLVSHDLRRPVFMGSFDNMYESVRQGDTGVNSLLGFVKATPWIAGIDLHIHHTDNLEIITAINTVNDKIRSDQKIIITEYSLVKWWKSHLTDDLSPTFIAAANADASDHILTPPAGLTKVWQYIDYALKNPRPVDEWNAFHQYTPWLEGRKDYLCASLKLFKNCPKFWVATYAVRQNYPAGVDFSINTDPWVLNSLFTSRTVQLMSNGEAEGRYGFFPQFVDINNNNTICP